MLWSRKERTDSHFVASYKHPRKRKLNYIHVFALDLSDALKKLPKQRSDGSILYGVS